MTDMLISLSVHWLMLFAVIAALALTRQVRVNALWLCGAVLIFAIYVTALVYLGRFSPLETALELNLNWSGKILAIIASLAMMTALWKLAGKPPSAMGVTLAQTPGSIRPALIATALLVAFAIGRQIVINDGPDTGLERLLYQATMPGLDEELFWRGVFLLALHEALRGRRLDVLGARIGWGGMISTALFALVHSFAYQDGAFVISWSALFFTSVAGFGLLWLRERTGSIVFPIVAHNLVNFLHSFF